MEIKILTASRSKFIGEGLTYETQHHLPPGSIVRVPLRDEIVDGLVLPLEIIQKQGEEKRFPLKSISEILSVEPLLSPAHLKTMQWMAGYYRCTLREALSVWLPAPPWSTLLGDESILPCHPEEPGPAVSPFETLRDGAPQDDTTGPGVSKGDRQNTLTPEQQRAYGEIKATPLPSLLFGVTASGKTEIYASLIADVVDAGDQAILLLPEILLTEHFIERFQSLVGKDRVAILHSRVTRSRRMKIWRSIRRNETSLVIGSRSALFAPAFRLKLVIIDEEHEWTYKNEQNPRYHARDVAEVLCRNAGAKLVLGSATPSLEAWGRATGDKGHKGDKGDKGERDQHGSISTLVPFVPFVPFVPSSYALVRLPDRYASIPYPSVRVIDLAHVPKGQYPFSTPLLEAIESRLSKGEQSILFLNKRGFSSALLCLACRRRVTSPDSNLPFAVHREGSQGNRGACGGAGVRRGSPPWREGRGEGEAPTSPPPLTPPSREGNSTGLYLLDHTSNRRVPLPTSCPSCGSTDLLTVGAGTQRLEQELCKRFPKARLLRADSDTMSTPDKLRAILRAMEKGEADILLGTQSIIKGLDLAGVTLAAVLIADIGLSLPHFRAGERLFQILTQLSGRSGRRVKGDVIIQTYRPDASEIRLAVEQKTEEYLEQEMKMRAALGYPPHTRMVRVLLRGTDASVVASKLLAEMKDRQRGSASPSPRPSLKGGEPLHTPASPSPPHALSAGPTYFGGGREWQILVRGPTPEIFLDGMDFPRGTGVDVDPVDCL